MDALAGLALAILLGLTVRKVGTDAQSLNCCSTGNLCCCSLQVVSWGSNWRNRWKYRRFPGPRPNFLLGNISEIRRKRSYIAYTDWGVKYGDVFRIFVVQQPAVILAGQSEKRYSHMLKVCGFEAGPEHKMLADPHLVRQVAITDFKLFRDRTSAANRTNPALKLARGNQLRANESGMILARYSCESSQAHLYAMFLMCCNIVACTFTM